MSRVGVIAGTFALLAAGSALAVNLDTPQKTPVLLASATATATITSRAAPHASPLAKPIAAPATHDSLGDMDCGNCHTTAGWKLGPGGGTGAGATAGGFDHAKTGFPLLDEHAHVTCLGCHVPGRPISRECAACHADTHEGRLGDRCDGCHRPSSWRETKVMEQHRRTRLPLTGMHAMIDCSACHLRNGERAWSETPADCFACHEAQYRSNTTHPSHEGNPSAIPPQPPFPRDCAVCHTSVAWTPAFLPAAFIAGPATSAKATADHERWFPLRSGKHRGLACDSCHPSGGTGPLDRADCTGCHEHSPLRMLSVHRGQSMPSDGAACLHCHPGGAAR